VISLQIKSKENHKYEHSPPSSVRCTLAHSWHSVPTQEPRTRYSKIEYTYSSSKLFNDHNESCSKKMCHWCHIILSNNLQSVPCCTRTINVPEWWGRETLGLTEQDKTLMFIRSIWFWSSQARDFRRRTTWRFWQQHKTSYNDMHKQSQH